MNSYLRGPLMATRKRAPGLWAWLLVAMVLAQSLGFMHSVVHTGPLHVERQVCQLHAEVQERAVTGWLAQLFAAHDGESDCRLYDQFSHGDCVPAMPVLCLPAQALPHFLQVFEASQPLTPAALVQARGPPSVR